MMIAGHAITLSTDSRLIEAGIRSALVSLGQMLPRGGPVLKSQDFIPSSAAARSCLQQLRCEGAEVTLSLSGRISGTFILALDKKAAQHLIAALTGEGVTTPFFNDIGRSALKEAGNIVASAFLGALESLCGRGGLPGVPDLHLGDPCHAGPGATAESHQMYALPLFIIAPAAGPDAARGGVFISLHSDDSTKTFPDV
jgi:hypothetical protein